MLRIATLCTAFSCIASVSFADPALIGSGSSVHAVRSDPGDGLCAVVVSIQGQMGQVFASTGDAIAKLESKVGQNMVADRKMAVYNKMRFHNMESTAVGDFPQAPSSQLPYDTYYALRLRGYLNISANNLLYTDAVYSLAGARLRIASTNLIDFNSNTAVRETRQISFAGAGLYPIEIIHYANGGIAVLEASQAASAQPEGPQTSLDTSKFGLIPGTQLFTARTGSTTACEECGTDGDCGSGNYCIHDWSGAGSVLDGLCSPCNTADHCGAACMKCGSSVPYCFNNGCVECLQDNQCAAGSRCIANQCKPAPSCPSDPACPAGQSCDPTDSCVAPCGACTDNLVCDPDRQICVPSCVGPADCPPGSSCDLTKQMCFRVERYVGGTGCSAVPGASRGSAGIPALALLGLLLALWAARLRRNYRRVGALSMGVFFYALLPGTAHAQLSANAATFHPAIGPDNIIVVDGSATPGRLKPILVGLLAYDNNPLRLISGNGITLANTVPHLVSLHLMGGLGLTRWLAIGLDVPVILYQGFDRQTPVSDVPTAPSQFGIADIRATAKVRIINNEKGGFGLAFAPLVTFPSGKGTDLRGSDGFGIEPRVALDYRLEGGHLIAVNLGFLARTSNQLVPDQLVTHTVTYGLGAMIAMPRDFGLLFDLSGGAAVQKTDSGPLYAPAELDGALRWLHRRSGFFAMLGAGGGLTSAVGSPQFRLFASLGYVRVAPPVVTEQAWLEIRKAGDGTGNVTSDVPGIGCGELCTQPFPRDTTVTLTAEPSPTSEFVEWTGPCSGRAPTCTVRLQDATQVGAHFRLRPDHGRVEVRKRGDGTGRVLSDPPGLDCGSSCTTGYPGGRVVFIAQPDPDSVFSGWSGPCSGKQLTCEVMITPGRPAEIVEAEFTRIVDPCKLRIKDVILFKTAEFTIEPESYPLLNEVARVLRDNPNLTLRIEGNTDNQAFVDRCDRHDLNPWLSQMRADAVRAYLRGQGIDERRLATIGYGSTNPAMDNVTPEHRHENRRTDFQRTDPAAAACPNFNPRQAPPAIGGNPQCLKGPRPNR